MPNIGFIGLGHMGGPMAKNLVKAGFNVTVFDLNPSAMDSLATLGAKKASSIASLAADNDVFITMLQTGSQVSSVCLSDDGLFSHAKPGSLFIDSSSIDVPTSRGLTQHALEKGLLAVDAPVSGGVAGAESASLTFMVGGNEESFNAALPLLQVLGKKIVHAGQTGTGQAAKICNNMILGISMAAISEAYVLAETLGLKADKLFEIASSASGQCWAMTSYSPIPGLVENVPSNNDYKPGFTAAMMLKDLALSQDAAKNENVHTELGQTAMQLYQQFIDAGNGDLDFSAIIKNIRGQ